MKTPRALALSIAATLFATPALAGLYRVDPNVSYVDAIVYQWTAWQAVDGSDYSGPSAPEPPVQWTPLQTLTRLPLSGTLQVATDASPFNPGWTHLLIVDTDLKTGTPELLPIDSILPQVTTYSYGGDIFYGGPCGGGDPYYGIPFPSNSCYTYGLPPTLGGHVEAGTIELMGTTGGMPVALETLVNVLPDYPNPPPPLDPSEYPSIVLGYHVLAHAVPEPATPALILVAGLLAFAVAPVRSRPHR